MPNTQPEGFWPRLRALDKQLHKTAHPDQPNLGLWLSQIMWTRVDPEDHSSAASERIHVTDWRGARILGGLVIFGQVRILRPVTSALEAESVEPLPATESRYVYSSSPYLLGSALHVHTTGYNDFRDEAESPLSVKNLWAVRQGMLRPTVDDYQFLLDEMAFGASGEGVPPTANGA